MDNLPLKLKFWYFSYICCDFHYHKNGFPINLSEVTIQLIINFKRIWETEKSFIVVNSLQLISCALILKLIRKIFGKNKLEFALILMINEMGQASMPNSLFEKSLQETQNELLKAKFNTELK